jgi:hypothetical protein
MLIDITTQPEAPLACLARNCTFADGSPSFSCASTLCTCGGAPCTGIIGAFTKNLVNSTLEIACGRDVTSGVTSDAPPSDARCQLIGIGPRFDLRCRAGECTQPAGPAGGAAAREPGGDSPLRKRAEAERTRAAIAALSAAPLAALLAAGALLLGTVAASRSLFYPAGSGAAGGADGDWEGGDEKAPLAAAADGAAARCNGAGAWNGHGSGSAVAAGAVAAVAAADAERASTSSDPPPSPGAGGVARALGGAPFAPLTLTFDVACCSVPPGVAAAYDARGSLAAAASRAAAGLSRAATGAARAAAAAATRCRNGGAAGGAAGGAPASAVDAPPALPRDEELGALPPARPQPPGGRRVLLRGVAGAVAEGELLGVLGPSGSGKSTLLSILSGRAEALGAGARVDADVTLSGGDSATADARAGAGLGRRSSGSGGAPRRRRRRGEAAFVPQKDVLLPALTVEESVRYVALLRLPRALSPREVQVRPRLG